MLCRCCCWLCCWTCHWFCWWYCGWFCGWCCCWYRYWCFNIAADDFGVAVVADYAADFFVDLFVDFVFDVIVVFVDAVVDLIVDHVFDVVGNFVADVVVGLSLALLLILFLMSLLIVLMVRCWFCCRSCWWYCCWICCWCWLSLLVLLLSVLLIFVDYGIPSSLSGAADESVFTVPDIDFWQALKYFFEESYNRIPKGNPMIFIIFWWPKIAKIIQSTPYIWAGGPNPKIIHVMYRLSKRVTQKQKGDGTGPVVAGRDLSRASDREFRAHMLRLQEVDLLAMANRRPVPPAPPSWGAPAIPGVGDMLPMPRRASAPPALPETAPPQRRAGVYPPSDAYSSGPLPPPAYFPDWWRLPSTRNIILTT